MIKVSIIIPFFNEQNTIIQILEKVSQQKIPGIIFEVIAIDDGSIDKSRSLLQSRPELYDKLITQENSGKGAAVKAGLKSSTGEYILFQDADLEYDPADYSKLIFPIIQYGADLVMGSRFVAPQCTRVYYFWHRIGNSIISLMFNVLNNTTFTDIYSCYAVFRRSLLDPDKLITNGWEQHAEILSRVVRSGSAYYEVPISYYGRTYSEGKKIKAHHVFAVILTIIRGRFFSQT
jgi:glycosyltransferase involved in cell wall biosynthesis